MSWLSEYSIAEDSKWSPVLGVAEEFDTILALLNTSWSQDIEMLDPTGCPAVDMFTSIYYIAAGGWMKEKEKLGMGKDNSNTPLLIVFILLLVAGGFTNMELSDIVSLVFWEIKEFGRKELTRPPVLL